MVMSYVGPNIVKLIIIPIMLSSVFLHRSSLVNTNDPQVCIQVDIPYDDNLRAMKLDLLQKHCLPKLKDAYFNSSGGSFIMKYVHFHAFS